MEEVQTLICINTCSRPSAVRAFLWDYVRFVKGCRDYHLIVSLDGQDPKTIEYCKKFNIPLIRSEKREGVGISKNRVLSTYPDYKYYFFLEDDVELVNADVFRLHILASQLAGLHHLSLFDAAGIRDEKARTILENLVIIHCMYGGASVNFFTREGVQRVGGFHEEFAKYRRFGHTEHTYRFVNAKLSLYPFNIIEKCISGYFRWHNPRSVTRIRVEATDNRIFKGEQVLIDERLTYYPIKTLSPYRVDIPIDIERIRLDRWAALWKCKFKVGLGILGFVRGCKSVIMSRRAA